MNGTTPDHAQQPDPDEPAVLDEPELTGPAGAGVEVPEDLRRIVKEQYDQRITAELGKIPRPINWRTLPPTDLEDELLELNAWVDWVRHEYALPAQIIPPMWHRHPELVWELSALRQHWLFSYDPQAKGNQALAWHHDFAAARERLRDWVTISGTRLDRDRPTRLTPWPGGEAEGWAEPDTSEHPVEKRTEDFLAFVEEQVAAREAEQEAFIRSFADED